MNIVAPLIISSKI